MLHATSPRCCRFVLPVLLVLATALTAAGQSARFTGPWDVDALKRVPEATWGEANGPVREVYYSGPAFGGKPTRIFGYYGCPEGDGPFPGMVLIHGGGGTAFAEWVELWVKRGYAALAMDTAGHGPGRVRLPDGGPEQDDNGKFRDFTDDEVDQMWTYHAVAAALLGHSLLADRPRVDADRIGVTGISWGGYLTCIVTGVDDRLKVSVPVYGCGFLHENSVWVPRFAKMTPEQRDRWVMHFDPSRYLPGVACPILFVNGTNDFAYPMDSYRKSYGAVPGAIDLCMTVRMPHGHPQGWAPKEIGLFVDSVLADGDRLARLGDPTVEAGTLSATIDAKVPLTGGQLHFTLDEGPWHKRNWSTVPARIEAGAVKAELPKNRPAVAFLTVTDQRGAVVSSPHLPLPKGK